MNPSCILVPERLPSVRLERFKRLTTFKTSKIICHLWLLHPLSFS